MWIFRSFMTLLLVSLVANIVFCTLALWLFFNRGLPNYYAIGTDEKTIISMLPQARPFVTDEMILRFAQTVALQSTALNFFNYNQALESLRQYFTEPGYNHFRQAMDSSGVITKIVGTRLVATGVITGIPVLTNKQSIFGDITWRVEIPMVINFEGPQSVADLPVVMRLIIQRVPTTETKQGILVSSYFLLNRRV